MVVQMNNIIHSIKAKCRHSLLVSLLNVIFEVNRRRRVALRSLTLTRTLYTVQYVHVIGSAVVSWPLNTKTRKRHLLAVLDFVDLRGLLLLHRRIKTFNVRVKVQKAALQQGKGQRLYCTLQVYVANNVYVLGLVNIRKKSNRNERCWILALSVLVHWNYFRCYSFHIRILMDRNIVTALMKDFVREA